MALANDLVNMSKNERTEASTPIGSAMNVLPSFCNKVLQAKMVVSSGSQNRSEHHKRFPPMRG